MNISELEKKMSCSSLWEGYQDRKIEDGYTSDLLSDVMGNAPDDSLLMTIQAHKNTVAVASLAGISGILLCSNRPAPEDMIEAAREEDIPLFRCEHSQYQASWMLHKLLEENPS